MGLQALRKHQLHSTHKKREFWLEEAEFLGYVILTEWIKVDLQKVKVFIKCARLTNVIEIKNFSSLAAYYQVREGFVKDRVP